MASAFDGRNKVFSICTPDRVFYLEADSEDSRTEWCETLQLVLKLKKQTASTKSQISGYLVKVSCRQLLYLLEFAALKHAFVAP
jgi:hypothetical protein